MRPLIISQFHKDLQIYFLLCSVERKGGRTQIARLPLRHAEAVAGTGLPIKTAEPPGGEHGGLHVGDQHVQPQHTRQH